MHMYIIYVSQRKLYSIIYAYLYVFFLNIYKINNSGPLFQKCTGKKVSGRSYLMSLAAHLFGRVEFWISNIWCCFLQAGAVEKIEQIFNIQNSTRPNQWATEDIRYVIHSRCFFLFFLIFYSINSMEGSILDRLCRSNIQY